MPYRLNAKNKHLRVLSHVSQSSSLYLPSGPEYVPSSAVFLTEEAARGLGRYTFCSVVCRPTVCTRNSRMFSPLADGKRCHRVSQQFPLQALI